MKKLTSLFLAFLLLSSVLGCENENNKPTEQKPTVKILKRFTVKEEEVPHVSTVTGTVKAIKRVTLSSRVNGYITSFPQREGDKVLKGDLLVEIDASPIEADLASAKANLAEVKSLLVGAESTLKNSEKEYKRAQELYKNKTIAKRVLEKRYTFYENNKAKVAQLKAKIAQAKSQINLILVNLNYTKILAPFDGVIIKKDIEEGELARSGSHLLTLESNKDLEVVANVNEADLTFISPKQHQEGAVSIEIEAIKKTLNGTLSYIIPSGDPFSHTFKVKVRLPRDEGILSGMFARLSFPVEKRKKLLIPMKMVIIRGELTAVKVLNNKEIEFRVIRIGNQYGDNVEVLSGLNNGETIVITQ